jgi:hypothetical protein
MYISFWDLLAILTAVFFGWLGGRASMGRFRKRETRRKTGT